MPCRRRPCLVTSTITLVDTAATTLLLSEFSLLRFHELTSIIGATPFNPSNSTYPCSVVNGTVHFNATSKLHCSFIPISNIFSLGGSTIDLWFLSMLRALLVVAFILLSTTRRTAPLFKFRMSIAALISCILQVVYVLVKALVRLIDGPGSGSPRSLFFWTMMGVTALFSVPQCQYMLYFIHDAIYWQETTLAASSQALQPTTDGMLQQPLLGHPDHGASQRGEKTNAVAVAVAEALAEAEAEETDDDKSEDEDELEIEREEYEKMQGRFAGRLSDQYTFQNGVAIKMSSSSSSAPSAKKTPSSLAWFRPPSKNKKKKTGASVWKLIQLGKVDLPWLLTAFVALLVAAIGQAYIPLLTGNLINEITTTKSLERLKFNTKQLAITAFVTAIFTALVRKEYLSVKKTKFKVTATNQPPFLPFFSVHLSFLLPSFPPCSLALIAARIHFYIDNG